MYTLHKRLPYKRFEHLISIFKTFSIACIGAFLFKFLHIFLPWLLGSIAAVAFCSIVLKQNLIWPVIFRNIGLVFLGFVLGTAFTLETLKIVLHYLPFILLSTVLLISFSVFTGFLISLYTDIDIDTAILGSIPGGLSHIVVIGEEFTGVNLPVVTIMQTFRVLIVILTVPFVALHSLEVNQKVDVADIVQTIPWYNFFLFAVSIIICLIVAKKIHLPISYLIASVFGTAILIMCGVEPPHLSFTVILSQILIGTYIGLKIKIDSFKMLKKNIIHVILLNIIVIGFSFIIAWLLSFILHIPLNTAFLSTAPGGIAEMGITATEVGADLVTVTSFQLFRIIFILVVIPPVLKIWVNRKGRASP